MVYDGEQAVEAFKSQEFYMVFLDVQMPIMRGYQASKHFRQLNSDVPIIAKSNGMNQFIGKPYSPDEILVVIEAFLPKQL